MAYEGKKGYHLGYSALIDVARLRGFLTAEGLAEAAGLPLKGGAMAGAVGKLLYEIVTNGRPMLSALVIKVKTGMPGEGFFALAKELGRLDRSASESEARKFWEKEVKSLYKAW